jgi:hypothetical protein
VQRSAPHIVMSQPVVNRNGQITHPSLMRHGKHYLDKTNYDHVESRAIALGLSVNLHDDPPIRMPDVGQRGATEGCSPDRDALSSSDFETRLQLGEVPRAPPIAINEA